MADAARLAEIGELISTMWDRRDLAAVEALYADDARFVSPNPPQLSADFGTELVGRAEIMRYYGAVLEVVPPGAVDTVAVAAGIDVVTWVWKAGADIGTDTMLVDGDGRISLQYVAMPLA
ncbi:MAG: nuclear transport factor 2 family protein [Actinomycetota bacterium]